MIMLVFMKTTCGSSKVNAKSNDCDHIFVIRENTHLKHRCPLDTEKMSFTANSDLFIRDNNHEII